MGYSFYFQNIEIQTSFLYASAHVLHKKKVGFPPRCYISQGEKKNSLQFSINTPTEVEKYYEGY